MSKFNPCPKPEKKAKKKTYRISPISKKRAEQNKKYLALREEFLKGKICPITKEKATQIHHKKGRIGKLFLDTEFWLAVSFKGHRKIEENPEWAKQQGYSLDRLSR